MSTVRWLVVGLLLAVPPVAAQGPSSAYWLVGQVTGDWEYRDAAGTVHKLTSKYDYLQPTGEVRCLETDLTKCALRYLGNPGSDATVKLPVPLKQTGVWVPLRGLPPPPPAVLTTTPSALQAKFTNLTKPGGSRAPSGCEGEFPLRAPVCNENIDVSDFRIRWSPGPDSSTGKLLVLVGRADGKATILRTSAPMASGEFSGVKLTDYLRTLQSQNETVDVVIKVSSDYNRRATRVVHIPPLAKTLRYEANLRQINYPDPVLRSVAIMSYAIGEGMWSRAAEEASRLTELVSGSPYLLQYVMAGLCKSDFEEAKSQARQYGPEDIYDRVCSASPAPRPTAAIDATARTPQAATPAPAPGAAGVPAAGSKPVETGTEPKTRPGIALLIGNWDYAGMPLNSVREDLKHMQAALEDLGFAVTVKQNLRRPQDFVEALDRTLSDEKATADDILFVYYSGHGVQIDGKAHLLGTGVSTKATTVEQIRGDAQSAEQLLSEMEVAQPGTRIFVVEACRDSFLSAPGESEARAAKGGFAFREDDVKNTFVMFANKPGLQTPARSDEGEMGPFTESLIQALHNSTGEIQDVFRVAAETTRQFSPGQEPDEHHSRVIDPVFLRPKETAVQDQRAKELLTGAEPFYRDRSWDKFLAKVDRGRALASSPELQQRMAREVDFANLAVKAEAAEGSHRWSEAAECWQKAGDIFPVRQWATMKAAVAWLLADNVPAGARALAIVAARSDADPAPQARRMLADLVKAYPDLEAETSRAAQGVVRITGDEFELIKHEE